jgi:glutaredoxin 3
MNLAYFRKSTFSETETIENVKKHAKELGLTVLGETALPGKNGTILHVCNPTWMGNLVASDSNLIGLLPCSIAVLSKKDEVLVGVGSPTVLGSVSQNPAIAQIASDAEQKLKELIHKSAGVGPMKPTGVKLYSTTTCPYCKMEAVWLDEKKVKFEEVHVDLNQKEAEDMVKKTGQMGVPVTAIQYEGGEEEYIVGFDRPQLAQILNV